MYPECIEAIWNNPLILPGRIGIIADAGKMINVRKKKNLLQNEVASRHPQSFLWKSWIKRTKINRLAQFFKYQNIFD